MENVKIWEEEVSIPTYETGTPNQNPMFLEKRVYQGSSGKVYPYPTIENISRSKTDKKYQAVYLENQYLKIMILPELGGRIQRAYDKTNDYDFVYYNQVIKPALVGLAGPWISGGIEFNWPQHHRPTTFMPVDHTIRENEDGSRTLLVNDVDQMYGTKGIAAFTLYPDKAYLEIRGQLYNRTPLPQTFLWWANPAVAVNENTQSIFPPDVQFVMDHGKRDVSRFPIARGIYYKHDYSEGVDISRYKNIPVPTSYMAESSSYDFVGGYDYGKEAGMLHIADHHIAPGKKQWTWGCGDFGKAWDRNLTDEDGPYIELMTGVFTENQPDFSWLKPFEEKTFLQYFMPYKKVGAVKNATIRAAINVEAGADGLHVIVYGTEKYENAELVLMNETQEIFRENFTLSPSEVYDRTIRNCGLKAEEICFCVYSEGTLLVQYQPEKQKERKEVHPAEAAKDPGDILTNEELYLTGLHIEQHRHATYLPDTYYLEGLKRDPGDIRINNAYGMLLLRRGEFITAEKHFRSSIERLTWRSPNPYSSEPYYNLGLSLFYQGKKEEAFEAFFKAVWSSEQQEMSYYYLAAIECSRGNLKEALGLMEKGLVKNMHNIKARGLKALLLRKLGRTAEALAWIEESLKLDPFDYMSLFEKSLLHENSSSILLEMKQRMSGETESCLQTARDYAESGCLKEAVQMLELCREKHPFIFYYLAYYSHQLHDFAKSLQALKEAEASRAYCCFPNKLEDIAVLEWAQTSNPQGARAYYYLGNLFYDKLNFERAAQLWETSARLDDSFPTVHRNLALSYYNKQNDPKRAREELEQAFALDETDTQVFFELDQLYKKISLDFSSRLDNYLTHMELVVERDDTMLELVTLYNQTGQYEKALETMQSHQFRPWEGAEGRISGQYKIALTELAKEKIAVFEWEEAEKLLARALTYPENLGEGKLEGTKDNHIYYYLGEVKQNLSLSAEAEICYQKALEGTDEPAGVQYYNDQPADMILYKGLAYQKLGNEEAAASCFCKLMEYGQAHLSEEAKPDFFAVSLPDFLIFEEDMNQKNRAHCYYLMGLSSLGFGQLQKAREYFDQCLETEPVHQNARIYKKMCI